MTNLNQQFYCTMLNPASWQCPCPYSLVHSAVFSKNKMVVVSQPPYSPSLAPCDFFYSPEWNSNWKRGVLLILLRFNKNHWQPLTFQMKILDSVSRSRRGTAIAASSHMWNTLKGTEVSNLYVHLKFFCEQFQKLLGIPSYYPIKYILPLYIYKDTELLIYSRYYTHNYY